MINWIEVLTICWPVFRVVKTPVYESPGTQLRDANGALIAITSFNTTALVHLHGYLTNVPQLNYRY